LMAEALLRKYAGNAFEVFSAGLEPKGVHPLTVQVLNEIEVDTGALYSKPMAVYIGKTQFDYLITVCSESEEKCPYFPGMGLRLNWPFEDPAAVRGDEAQKLARFREVRDQIGARIRAWLTEMDITATK